jgi:hypothetical protein
MEQKQTNSGGNGMLIFQPPTDIQRLRELFIYARDKHPEDIIYVGEAIKIFADYEKHLIAERDAYRKMWQESFNYSGPQPILMSKDHCDPAALVGKWIPYNSGYNITNESNGQKSDV